MENINAKQPEYLLSINEALDIKASAVCYGLRPSKTLTKIYQPTDQRRTGNTGFSLVLLQLGDYNLGFNVICNDPFCQDSPYSLEEIKNEIYLCKGDKPICKPIILAPPAWYDKYTSDGILMSDILTDEGPNRTLTTAVYAGCCYRSTGEQCLFCTLGADESKDLPWKKPDQIAEVVKTALNENHNYRVHLTGGNTQSEGRGLDYYVEVVKIN